MSVNVYVSNKICDAIGFTSQPSKDNSYTMKYFKGMSIFEEKGRLYLMWSEVDPIPVELEELVEEITWHETIPRMGSREAGIYRHETAECELVPDDYGKGKLVYKLKLRAKKLEDIYALLQMVKTGMIRPKESYEGQQSGKASAQLESELAQIQRQLDYANTTIEELRETAALWEKSFNDHLSESVRICVANDRLRQLARTIKDESLWPIVLRSTVVKQINALLDTK